MEGESPLLSKFMSCRRDFSTLLLSWSLIDLYRSIPTPLNLGLSFSLHNLSVSGNLDSMSVSDTMSGRTLDTERGERH